MHFDPISHLRGVVIVAVVLGEMEEELDVITFPWQLLILAVSNVTAALSANNPPLLEDPVVTVIEVNARMFPAKRVPVPIVAELPTCQKTLHGSPPLMSTTEERDAVVRVLPIWNTN